MKKIIYLALSAAISMASSVDSGVTNPRPPIQATETGPAATGGTNPHDWKTNHRDIYQYMTDLNGKTDSAGTGSQIMGQLGVTPNKMKDQSRRSFETSVLSANPEFKDTPSLGAYGKYEQSIITAATQNTTAKLSTGSGQIRCYITRDIGFAYRCTKTGLTYGGQINADARAAKNQCLSECFEDFGCVTVRNSTQTASDLELVPFALTASASGGVVSKSFNIVASPTRKTSLVTIKAHRDSTQSSDVDALSFNLDISFVKSGSSTVFPLAKRLFFSKTQTETSLTLQENVESFTVKVYGAPGTLNSIVIDSIKSSHQDESKWICKGAQDITDVSPSNFSNICQNGKVNTLILTNGNEVKICKNANSGGDNQDGTYSSEAGCSTACRVSHECVPSYAAFGETRLHSFREGCISGDCIDDTSGLGDAAAGGDCKAARMSGMSVIEEDVFNANMDMTKTVSGSVQKIGVERPRIMDADDTDYVNKEKEESKDAAYKNMQAMGTYTSTKDAIEDDTAPSSAYGIGMSAGVDAGTLNSTQRTLYWKLKPSAHDALTNKNLFYYAIIEADIDYFGYDINARIVPKRDRVWFIKTSASDTFKAIRRSVEYSIVTTNANGMPSDVPNAYASKNLETLAGSSWTSISGNQTAEAFKTGIINVLSPYEMIPIADNMSKLFENLPGIVHSEIVNGPQVTKVYTGPFGVGRQAMSKFSVYPIYTNTSKTYNELLAAIDNETVKPIFTSNAANHFTKEVDDDGANNSIKEVQIFKYGVVDNLSAYMRIKPKITDIGKHGFVFVFVY